MKRRERGFALLAVVMGIAVLATIAAALSVASRINILAASALVGSAQADLAADAGIALAIDYLADGFNHEGEHQYSPVICSFDDAILRIAIADEAGKVDINAAPAELLTALFRGFSGDEIMTKRRTAAVIDFIDPDDVDHITGESELARSIALGKPPPRNAPLAMIDELDQVPGFDQDVRTGETFLDIIRPHVTVLSRRPGVDPKAAAPALLVTLAAAQAEMPAQFVVPSEMRYFTVRADAITGSGYRFAREVAIERNPLLERGYNMLGSWMRAALFDGEWDQLRNAPSCSAALFGKTARLISAQGAEE
jgi:general secretion pathway protein K